MIGRNALNFCTLWLGDIGDDEVLIGCDAEVAIMQTRDPAQSCEHLRPARKIAHASAFEIEGQMRSWTFRPAVAVAGRGEREWLRRVGRGAPPARALLSGIVHPPVLCCVFLERTP